LSANNKHILVLSSWYPSRVKPFLGNFIKRFVEIISVKYKVTVLYTISDATISEIELTQTQNANLTEIIVYYPKQKFILSKLLMQYRALKMGLNLIKNVSFIHANVLFPKGLQFYIAKRYYKCPMILSEHGSYYREEVRRNRTFFQKIFFSFLSKQFDQVIAVSDLLRKDMQHDFKTKTITIIPNAINTKLFIPPSNKKSSLQKIEFLHVSTLDESIKDPKGILDACKLLVKGGCTNFHLTVVSDEPYTKWESYLYSKNIVDFVTFIGPLEEKQLVPYYQSADAFLLFSKYETFSIVLAEAWSCGLPVITTPVGIGETIDMKLGYQVEVGNAALLARTMFRFTQEKDRFDSHLIRTHSKQYSSENVLSIYKKVINQLTVK
jgi:glycosyltransferase involved in cell wall biosynthesis